MGHYGDPTMTRNYLRVRGEYNECACNAVSVVELPPRARRILLDSGNDHDIVGTTSACAENTHHSRRL